MSYDDPYSSYQSYESPSRFGPYLVVALVLAALISASTFLFWSGAFSKDENVGSEKQQAVEKDDSESFPVDSEDVLPMANSSSENPDSVPTRSPEQILEDLGLGAEEVEPTALLQKIAEALEKGELESAARLIGKDALDSGLLQKLKALQEDGVVRLKEMNPIVEIGELERNRKSRWAIILGASDRDRIFFDLIRGRGGKWSVEDLELTGSVSKSPDALGVTTSFLQAALDQKFDLAHSFVDHSQVSDAKIAGLCIIFEEAEYRLRKEMPLRAMFNRPLTAGFVAHVENQEGKLAAEFGIRAQRTSEDGPWKITEINLDSLLADYATELAGDDVHFTPLIKNPAGGDTLILYFGFDEAGLVLRTKRQLDIVASLLKLDPKKKLTLSGHTDSKGSDDYNNDLSRKRAFAVEKYLLEVGVPQNQIVSLAEGEARPRVPNQTEDGNDSPTGRRANRRTEIYLDF